MAQTGKADGGKDAKKRSAAASTEKAGAHESDTKASSDHAVGEATIAKAMTAQRSKKSKRNNRTLVIGASAAVLLVAIATGVWMWFSAPDSPSEVLASMKADRQPPRWGTFRPNVYFGTKARVPDSPLFGMIWYSPKLDPSMCCLFVLLNTFSSPWILTDYAVSL